MDTFTIKIECDEEQLDSIMEEIKNRGHLAYTCDPHPNGNSKIDILRILRENGEMDAKDINAEMVKLGWSGDRKEMKNKISDLVAQRAILPVGRTKFRIA